MHQGASRLPNPAPSCLFISQSGPFMSGKINRQLDPGVGKPGEEGSQGEGHATHPPAALGCFIDNQEGSEKKREKKEVKTALLLATGSKRPPSLPSSFFIFKCWGAGERCGGGERGSPAHPSPRRTTHPPPFRGRQRLCQAAGSPAAFALHRDLMAPSCHPAGYPQSHPTGARSPGTGSAATPTVWGRGTTGQGLPGHGTAGLGASPGARASRSQLLRAPRRGQPGSCAGPAFPHFQDPAFKAAATTRGAGGGSCKNPPNLLFFSHCNTGVGNPAEKKRGKK